MRSLLTGIGGYLPEQVVTNDELAARVDTSDAWIRERTGIRQRHLSRPHETTAYMGTRAARAALAQAGASAADVDLVILATSTPDQAFPATALRVQAELGVKRGFGFDLSAACAGFVYGLSVADALRAFWIGTIAAPASCSATAPARCSCRPARTATAACCPPTCTPMGCWATSSMSTAPSDGRTGPEPWR